MGYFQPLDVLLFAIMKKNYRSWLGQYKLDNGHVQEQVAIKKVVQICSEFTQNQINGSFRKTGFSKFKNGEIQETEISHEEIMDELNCKAEELQLRD